MPQLSLYVTDGNLALLRERARVSGLSMSKYVNRLIEEDSRQAGWPSGFWGLYGALEEDPAVPGDPQPSDDADFAKMLA